MLCLASTPQMQLSPRRPAAAACVLAASPFLARRSVSRMSSSVSTSRASATSADRQADHLPAHLVEVDLDAHLVALDAFEHAAEPLAARDQLLGLDLGLVARPMPRSRTAAPAACRCRARKPRACTGPASGSCASSTGESWREISAHSSTVIVPSGPLGHDLHGRAVAPRDQRPAPGGSPVGEHRLGQARDLGRQRRSRQRSARRTLARSPSSVPPGSSYCVSRSSSDRPKQKERTPRAHSQS